MSGAESVVSSTINISSAELNTQGALTVEGDIHASGDVSLSTAAEATLTADIGSDALTISAGRLAVRGADLAAKNDLSVDAKQLDLSDSQINANGTLELNVDAKVNLSSAELVAGRIVIEAVGSISATGTRVTAGPQGLLARSQSGSIDWAGTNLSTVGFVSFQAAGDLLLRGGQWKITSETGSSQFDAGGGSNGRGFDA